MLPAAPSSPGGLPSPGPPPQDPGRCRKHSPRGAGEGKWWPGRAHSPRVPGCGTPPALVAASPCELRQSEAAVLGFAASPVWRGLQGKVAQGGRLPCGPAGPATGWAGVCAPTPSLTQGPLLAPGLHTLAIDSPCARAFLSQKGVSRVLISRSRKALSSVSPRAAQTDLSTPALRASGSASEEI